MGRGSAVLALSCSTSLSNASCMSRISLFEWSSATPPFVEGYCGWDLCLDWLFEDFVEDWGKLLVGEVLGFLVGNLLGQN